MQDFNQEFFSISEELDQIYQKFERSKEKTYLENLEKIASEIGKSWSGSWLGYHACVYYKDFRIPPKGSHFSQEWGLIELMFNDGTTGTWIEYNHDDVRNLIFKRTDNAEFDNAQKMAEQAGELFEAKKEESLSLLIAILKDIDDLYLERQKEEIESGKILFYQDFLDALQPKGKFLTRDTRAGIGLKPPPHLVVFAEISALRNNIKICCDLSKRCKQIGSHLLKVNRKNKRIREIGTNVFIGHGRSKAWKDLKDFIQDRLKLPWDEFNRIPVAGITNISRLSEMLNDAAIAFIVMTAEDEQISGKKHARMNVIHEAGLFQGKLGFTKAIIVLEEGCEEFSNIHGLGQIRFPKNNIQAVFEEIRLVLEREELL